MKNATILIIGWIIIVICFIITFVNFKKKNTYHREGLIIGAVVAIIYSSLMYFKNFPEFGCWLFPFVYGLLFRYSLCLYRRYYLYRTSNQYVCFRRFYCNDFWIGLNIIFKLFCHGILLRFSRYQTANATATKWKFNGNKSSGYKIKPYRERKNLASIFEEILVLSF